MTEGRFWIGAGGSTPMHVEWQAPVPPTGKLPLVLIHGGGGHGGEWLRTPDGRPGWAGGRRCRGRRAGPSAHSGSLAALLRPAPDQLRPPIRTRSGRGRAAPEDDPVLAAMLARARPIPVDLRLAHELERHAGAALLDRVGPAVLITHSAGAPAGWLMADARPQLVRAVIALEPSGPPFRAAQGPRAGLPCGLTAVPLRSGLGGIPVVIVSAEASTQRQHDTAVRDYLLEQAGAEVELLRLAEHGVSGNGHGMIFERKHFEVLGVVLAALERLVPPPG